MLQCSQPPWMPAGFVQDGFPQQRGWSDRFWKITRFPRGQNPFPVEPTTVAAGASSHKMKIETLSVDFTDEQKRYLEGFTSGLQISRAGRGLGSAVAKTGAEPVGPDAAHIKAQDKVIASGKKLADPEKY